MCIGGILGGMESTANQMPTAGEVSTTPQALCSYCHQPLLPQYYFCPNCGKKVNEPPLSLSVGSQVGLYFFSAVLPLICYLAISKWQGLKYLKSKDDKTQTVGAVACLILLVSTILTIWFAYVATQNAIQSSLSSLNSSMSIDGTSGL
jgi:hypothetical protein